MSLQSSSTTPDPFDIGTTLTAIESNDCVALNGYISIPNLSPDGSQTIATAIQHYQDRVCGSDFGIEGGVAGALVCKFNIFDQYFHKYLTVFEPFNFSSSKTFPNGCLEHGRDSAGQCRGIQYGLHPGEEHNMRTSF